MKVLIVKTSSMGDVLHTLPAVEDAYRHIPGITFDWVVEEGFKEIPAWHPAVQRVIPMAWRRWRRNLWDAKTHREGREFIQTLRSTVYDIVIDAQGLLKSAAVTALAKSHRKIGLDWHSAREPLASLFYHEKISVPKKEHAIQRLRQLFAKALHYSEPSPDTLHAGVELSKLTPYPVPNSYVVLLHATTWSTKHWPESHWAQLVSLMSQAGYHVLLPWGSEPERLRAERLAAFGGQVLPKLPLSTVAYVLKKAQGCVAVDTGLGHVAAAMGTPTVSLYGPTSPGLTGAIGSGQQHLMGAQPCAPCFKRTCALMSDSADPMYPPCLASLTPKQVLAVFLKTIQG